MRRSGFIGGRAKSVSLLVLAAATVWAVWYVGSNPGVLEAVRLVPLSSLAALVVLVLGIFLSNGLTTKAILGGYDKHLSIGEAFLLSAATTAANYALPARSGAGMRAIYLKKSLDFDLLDFATTLSGVFVLAIGVNGALGLTSVLLLVATGRPFDIWVAGAFGVSTLCAASVVAVPLSISRDGSTGRGVLARIVEGWQRIRDRKGLLARLIAITFAQAVLMLVQTLVAFDAIGQPIPIADALFFTAAKGLALLTTITPGALGVVEWLSVYMAANLSFSPDQSFAAQAVMRTVTVASAFVVGPIAAFILGQSFRRRVPDTEQC